MDFRQPPHLSDIDAQIRWEMSGVERGVDRARDQMNDQKVGDSEVGMKLMRRVVPPLIEKIKAAQAEASEAVANPKRGRPQFWWWLILLLPADQLAVITLKGALNERPREFTFNFPVVRVANNIARAAWTQLDYELWREAQGEKDPGDNEFLHYLRRTKQPDVKSFKKFSEKIARKKIERWDFDTGIVFGVKLIELLCAAAPDWFSVKTNRLRGGRTENQLVMSEDAKETIYSLTEQTELSRPMLLPMIIPPADWRIAE
jgi:hypothetical protein